MPFDGNRSISQENEIVASSSPLTWTTEDPWLKSNDGQGK